MNTDELMAALVHRAEVDVGHGEINDHICVTAVKAINTMRSDIMRLKELALGRGSPTSKRSQVLLLTPYDPQW